MRALDNEDPVAFSDKSRFWNHHDLKQPSDLEGINRSQIWPEPDLSRQILKWLLQLTGNQWWAARTGAKCLLFSVPVKSLAAVFVWVLSMRSETSKSCFWVCAHAGMWTQMIKETFSSLVASDCSLSNYYQKEQWNKRDREVEMSVCCLYLERKKEEEGSTATTYFNPFSLPFLLNSLLFPFIGYWLHVHPHNKAAIASAFKKMMWLKWLSTTSLFFLAATTTFCAAATQDHFLGISVDDFLVAVGALAFFVC